MKPKLVALAIGAALAASAGAAFAHHSFAMFDSGQQVTLAGTVKEFQWVNPHAWIMLTVADPEGRPALWAIEMGGPGQLARVGWNAGTLSPGMDVKVAIHPLRDGSNGGQYVGLTFPDGAKLGNP
jgi:hypothetical protein